MGNFQSKKKSNSTKSNIKFLKQINKLENDLKHIKSLKFSNIDNNIKKKLNCKISNIIFEGNGINSIAYCGALDRLNELGYLKNVNGYCGSNIGSICACLLSIGYTTSELITIIKNTNFNDFIDNEIGYIHDYYNLLNNYGYCSGNHLYNWIGTLIQEKVGNSDYTFNNLWNNHKKYLIITGTNLSNLSTQYYSYKNYPNMLIRDAIRISMTIPFMFTPIEWDNNVLVDGGISNKYPLDIFDTTDSNGKINLNWNSIGIKLNYVNSNDSNNLEHGKCTVDGLQSFNYSLVNNMYNNKYYSNTESSWLRSITINIKEIEPIQFNINRLQKEYLINQGIIGVDNFFKIRNEIKNIDFQKNEKKSKK